MGKWTQKSGWDPGQCPSASLVYAARSPFQSFGGSTWECSGAAPMVTNLNCSKLQEGRVFGAIISLEIVEHLNNQRQLS